MWLRIDPGLSEPIFAQIRHGVRSAMARGELADGFKLPSVRELARELSVNPNTVVRAYQVLEQEGVIVKRHGAGCFIRSGDNVLSQEERLRRLAKLSANLVTEAYHLGFTSFETQKAIKQAFDHAEKPRKGKRN